ncbi:gamma-glutamyltranspeptidase/glutathione hydrolase [Cupriavidus plantarum]|uniref:Gamma-glutamyltransferase 1 n=2 Tax=Cupriavidus plantarum TaxID=942865 RepID=A0A316F1K9_9BURK|nr:gamma-glutamyltranspeptidase/glutathione hydrolase [Cupriavidus plantarum]PWK37618.1 gamma-glutamyltransferase 1 [Cupriavidus plantarum]REF01637.1 gamma-glutamyltransferase 1 [Cupriavidus plantarum]RLK45504.1 gamma-glutamyltransferase 1 [Cupriavidus plantarum]CAG2128142.1 Glutathione hydrolase proenzyme [Cupriavidus plantarum]
MLHLKRTQLGMAAAVASTLLIISCGGSDDPPTASNPSTPATPVTPADTSCQVLADNGSTVVVGSNQPGDPSLPEPASGYRKGLKQVSAKTYMVSSSNAYASAAGCAILKKGGSAADAAVAVQSILGLTVPEATGMGSGGFMLYYDARTKSVQAYDGRESAPAAATENYLRYIDDVTAMTTPVPSARASGRSIGTIGIPRLIERVQKEHGKLAWKDLFGDAISLASNGFPIGGRLAAAISSNATSLKRDPEALAYFFNADGTPKALGTVLKNPAYANTLTQMAANGANAIYTGQIAQDIVNKIATTTAVDGSAITPGKTTLADLAAYQAKMREPICTTYRAYWICGAPPPTSGGITVLSAMGILENFDMASMKPTAIDGEGGKPTVLGVHYVSEAERLAYSDRDKYVADTDFVPLPGGSANTMLNKPYMASRAALISPTASMGTATAGALGSVPLGVASLIEHGTNHFSIVDADGSVVSATTSVESSMGSFHMTNGFLLNNQLTDFNATPTDSLGVPIANRVQPGKRPRSSMSPTMVFRKAADGSIGDFFMATGSPGGGTIPQYVVKTLVGVLDWGLDAQQSSGLVDFGASNSATTTVGGEHPNIDVTNSGNNDTLITGLRSLGHTISTSSQSSGVNTIIRSQSGGTPIWIGGTDPRREGVVLGDTFRP